MSEGSTFRLGEDGTATIGGNLTLDTVRGLYRSSEAALQGDERLLRAVELREVERIDSSGLALLLEWQARAGRSRTPLTIRNAPQDLLRIAHLCGAEDLLDLNGRAGNDEEA